MRNKVLDRVVFWCIVAVILSSVVCFFAGCDVLALEDCHMEGKGEHQVEICSDRDGNEYIKVGNKRYPIASSKRSYEKPEEGTFRVPISIE